MLIHNIPYSNFRCENVNMTPRNILTRILHRVLLLIGLILTLHYRIILALFKWLHRLLVTVLTVALISASLTTPDSVQTAAPVNVHVLPSTGVSPSSDVTQNFPQDALLTKRWKSSENVLGIPKAKSRKKAAPNIRKKKTIIATSTPVKLKIERMQKLLKNYFPRREDEYQNQGLSFLRILKARKICILCCQAIWRWKLFKI